MTIPAPDAIERIKSLIAITESLSDIFVEENKLLATQRPSARQKNKLFQTPSYKRFSVYVGE